MGLFWTVFITSTDQPSLIEKWTFIGKIVNVRDQKTISNPQKKTRQMTGQKEKKNRLFRQIAPP
jgi:hypothetical protein